MATRTIEISFGALSDPIAKQCAAQGVRIKADDLKHLQLDADAVSRLYLRGLLADAEKKKAHARLMKAITSAAKSA